MLFACLDFMCNVDFIFLHSKTFEPPLKRFYFISSYISHLLLVLDKPAELHFFQSLLKCSTVNLVLVGDGTYSKNKSFHFQ